MATPTAFFEGAFVPLEQANINVMTHAFNYGTAVFEGVRGNWNEEQGQLYLFKVREHIERIFERFYQVPGEGTKQRGTGLGLAIARSVAELHRGVIAVRNLEDKGCEFEVRLPRVR